MSPEVGRVEGALARAAERVFRKLLSPRYTEEEVESVFLRLVSLGDAGGATRRIARKGEFDTRLWAMVQELADEAGNRLVLISGTEDDQRAEISHEALVTQWPRFQRWLRSAAPDKRTHEALIERTRDWASAITEESRTERLSTGPELQLYSSLLERRASWFSPTEKEFVKCSQMLTADRLMREERRANREKNLFRGGLAAVSLLLIVSLAAAVGVTLLWRTTSTALSSLRFESAQRLSVQSQQFLDTGDLSQSTSSLLEAAELLSKADGDSHVSGRLLSSLVRVVSSLAPPPLPIPTKNGGFYLWSAPDTLVTIAPNWAIEIWKTSGPGHVDRIGVIDLKSQSFFLSADVGRRELYTYVLGENSISRWSLIDGAFLDEIHSPVLPKDNDGALDFRPHLGGLIVSDGKVAAVFDPTLDSIKQASAETLALFERDRPTDADTARLTKIVAAQPNADVVGSVQFSLEEFASAPRMDLAQSCSYAVSGANDGILKIWDTKSGTLAKSIEVGDRIIDVSISPTCDMVASRGHRSGIIVTSLLDSSKKHRIFADKFTFDRMKFDESGSALLLLTETKLSIVALPSSIARNANAISDVIDFVPSEDSYLLRTIKPTQTIYPWLDQYYKEDNPTGKLFFSVRDAKTLQPRCTAHVDYPDGAVSALKPDEQETFAGTNSVDEKERLRVKRVIDGRIVLIGGKPCSYFLVGVAHHLYTLELVHKSGSTRWKWRPVASLNSAYRNVFPYFWTEHEALLDAERAALYTDDGWRLFTRDPTDGTWTSVSLDDREFGRMTLPPGEVAVDGNDKQGLPDLRYLGSLSDKSKLVVLSTSTETLIVDDRGHTKARFKPAPGCRQIVARTRRGDLLVQEFESGKNSDGCKPRSSRLDPESLSPQNMTTGYLATPDQSTEWFFRVQGDRVGIVSRLGHVQCELPEGALKNVELLYPTVTQMDVRARVRVVAGGFYFGPAWRSHRGKTKLVTMDEAGLVAAVTHEDLRVYRLADCQEVGKIPFGGDTWSAVPISGSKLLVTANGDRSYSLWDAAAVVEVFRGMGVAQIRNVVGDDANVFSIEGIRGDLNFVRVDPVASALAKEGGAALVAKLRDRQNPSKQDAEEDQGEQGSDKDE